MGRLLVGERNLKHRSLLKEMFSQLAPNLTLDFAGNGDDILDYLSQRAPEGEPVLIVLDSTLPSMFPGSIVHIIKADLRFSKIPIVILTEQASGEYYALRDTGLVTLSFFKPSRANGWELLARRIIELASGAKR